MEKQIFKPFNIEVKSVDEDKREITAVGSQQKVDRDGDVIKVDGVNLKNYKKNPVVLWSHNHNDPPIGRTKRVWKDGGKLMFKIEYAPPETYSFADTIYKLTKSGYINAYSIGFVPDWEAADANKKSGGFTFNKTELLEISAVNVPANPTALVESKSIQKALEDEVIDNTEAEEMLYYLKKIEKAEVKIKDVYFDEEYLEKEEEELKKLIKLIEKEVKEDLENDSIDDDNSIEQTLNKNTCPHCGKEYIQKEDDSDPFEWLFKEHQTEESIDETNDDLVDELLNKIKSNEV